MKNLKNKNKIVKNSLGYDNDLFIFQDKNMFNYSVDTILLGNFIPVNKKTLNYLEIGTNNGALAIFLAKRSPKISIDAVEIQEKACKLAAINLEETNTKNQINIICEDFKKYAKKYAEQNGKKYDAIFCNPPFFKVNNFIMPSKSMPEKIIATHEIAITLEEIIELSSKIIKQKGYFSLVIPVERLVDAVFAFKKNNFEVKKMQFVLPRIHEKPRFCLMEARYGSNWGTHFLKNLYLYNEDKNNHEYKKDIKNLYRPLKEK